MITNVTTRFSWFLAFATAVALSHVRDARLLLLGLDLAALHVSLVLCGYATFRVMRRPRGMAPPPGKGWFAKALTGRR